MLRRPLPVPFWERRLLVRTLRRPARGARRASVLMIGLLLIAVWQKDFFARAPRLDNRYVHAQANGVNQEYRFLYFMYYLGLFPVVATDGHTLMRDDPGYRKFTRAAAERVIAEHGDTLAMEVGATIRTGDLGRALLYLPYALWSGSARNPRLTPTHAVAFTLALAALFAAFWWIRDPSLGAVAVALLGSDPFQLHEVHAHDNVFGWAMTAGILTLALCLPLLPRGGGRGRAAWLLALSVGALLATVRQIRPEPVTIIASALLACLLAAGAPWRRRVALAAVLLGAYLAVAGAWEAWFGHKFEEARQVVAAAGGHLYRGPRDLHHTFWHSLWCGLGDFGQEYGYGWNDMVAARYAEPMVAARYHAMGREPDWAFLLWDPVYNQVLREKIVHDVTHHPLWYAGVLARRAARVLTWTTPVRLAAGPWHTDLPWSGIASLPLFVVLAWTRSWSALKLALFPVATSAPAVLVFSGTVPGQTYTGWFHVMAAAIVLAGLIEAALVAGRRARRGFAPGRRATGRA